jgi:hypothetical protein
MLPVDCFRCKMDSQVQIEGRLLDIVTDDWKKEK